MKRTVISMLVVMSLLFGCAGREGERTADGDLRYAAVQAPYAQLQWDLARWYNVNLHSENPEPGFRESYSQVLAVRDSVMGYVEFPRQGITLPIYHEGAEAGVSHDAESDFPVGGHGNRAVLTCWEPLRLEKEEEMVICILGERLIYRRGIQSDDQCTVICGNASYTLGRVVEN